METPRLVISAANFLAQAAEAERWLRDEWQRLLADGYREEQPGVLVKRDEEGKVIATVTT